MPKLQPGTRLVVASHNAGKVREILDLVAPHGLAVVSAGELGLPEPEETGTTFAANAELKALAAARAPACRRCRMIRGSRWRRWAARPASIRRAGPGEAKDFAIAMRRVADELRARGGLEPDPDAGAARQLHRRAVPGLAGRGNRAV